ncbi:Histone-lysine N-methyltransferase SUVR4 [Quillaja saponaria]|uniref:Histone-lysine N-methyltransferase SUVR4 n=1 Tax=Quillaja saponaria TaxID=32244 RepID=A0AAD7PH88_QUISA|nr:Histone-lysine N-methyltransferase SUVR4 [Quillaja saponaria]KAJ7955469.1 Histone-lysine N-methyltransferase SUVR4 [Quillaja saponaria]
MPPKQKQKIADACKAMKQYDITQVEVKSALKELLELYHNSWVLIEDEEYKVLLDFILQKKQGEDKRKESNKKESCSNSKLKEVKSEKKKTLLHVEPIVAQLSTRRLRARDDKGQVVPATPKTKSHLLNTSSQVANQDIAQSSSDSQTSSDEDSEPLLKKPRIKHQKSDSRTSSDEDDKSPTKVHVRNQEELSLVAENNISFLKKSRSSGTQLKGWRDGVKLSSGSHKLSEHEACKHIMKRIYHSQQDEHTISPPNCSNLQPAAASNRNSSDVMWDDLKFLQLEYSNAEDRGDSVSNADDRVNSVPNAEGRVDSVPKAADRGDSVPNSSEIDIASTLKGELMGDLCECYWAMGIPSSVDNCEWTNNLPLSKISDSQEVLNQCDSQDNYCNPQMNSNCFAILQNRIKLVPQIPTYIALSGLEDLHYVIGFKIRDIGEISGCKEWRIKLLKDTESSTSYGVDGVQKHQFSLEACEIVDDITRGEEKVKISLVNNYGADNPPNFFYIQQNLVCRKAYVNFTLARISDDECCSECYGNCLSPPIPCARARETGGEYAYTKDGLV